MADLKELRAAREAFAREVSDAAESESGMCSLGIVEYDL